MPDKVIVNNTTSTGIFLDWFDRFRFTRKLQDLEIPEWQFLKTTEGYNKPEALRDFFTQKLCLTIDTKYRQIGHKMWAEWLYYAFTSVDWFGFLKVANNQSQYGLYDNSFASFDLPVNHETPPKGNFKNIDLSYEYILNVHLANDDDLRDLVFSKQKISSLLKSEITFNLAMTGERFYFKNLDTLVADRTAREQYRKLLTMLTKDIWRICINNKIERILKEVVQTHS